MPTGGGSLHNQVGQQGGGRERKVLTFNINECGRRLHLVYCLAALYGFQYHHIY